MVNNAVNRQINRMDSVEYGKVGDLGPLLADSLGTYRKVLLQTPESLGTTSDQVAAAIDAYSHVDETSASELTEAGKDIKDYERNHTRVEVIELEDEPPS